MKNLSRFFTVFALILGVATITAGCAMSASDDSTTTTTVALKGYTQIYASKGDYEGNKIPNFLGKETIENDKAVLSLSAPAGSRVRCRQSANPTDYPVTSSSVTGQKTLSFEEGSTVISLIVTNNFVTFEFISADGKKCYGLWEIQDPPETAVTPVSGKYLYAPVKLSGQKVQIKNESTGETNVYDIGSDGKTSYSPVVAVISVNIINATGAYCDADGNVGCWSQAQTADFSATAVVFKSYLKNGMTPSGKASSTWTIK